METERPGATDFADLAGRIEYHVTPPAETAQGTGAPDA
jgi:hypothetical protein